MSERHYVVNPILVQAYSDKAVPIEDAYRIVNDDTSALWRSMHERMAGQIEAGPSEGRYFTPDNPTSIGDLSESRRHDLGIGLEAIRNIGDNAVTAYYLSETALALRNYQENCQLLSVSDALRDGQSTLLRTEESLSEEAAKIQSQITHVAITAEMREGKKVVTLPGHKSPVPVAGWWIFSPDGSRHLLDDVPSCEMFMTATTLDQSRFGDEVVRIVPHGMEDREVAVHRILDLIDKPVNGYSIVTAPSGDIKRMRRWGDGQISPAMKDLYESMRVDGLANKTANAISKQTKDKHAKNNQHLDPSYSPNRNRHLEDALQELVNQPYNSLSLYEKFKPKNAEEVSQPLENIRLLLQECANSVQPELLTTQYVPGRNTNSMIDAQFLLATVQDAYGRSTDVLLRIILSRTNDKDNDELHSIAKDSPDPERFTEWLANNDKLHYLLIEGNKR